MARAVSSDNMNPNNNLNDLAHDLGIEVPFIPKLPNLINDSADALVLILKFGSTICFVRLANAVRKIGYVTESEPKIRIASTLEVEERRYTDEGRATEISKDIRMGLVVEAD